MSTLTQIVDGLQTRLKTITAFDQAVLDVVRRPATFPAAIIVPPAIPKYGGALAGQGGQFTIQVLVLVGTSEAEKQTSLFPFLDWTGPSSIAATVAAVPTLGLSGVNARVIASDEPTLRELPDSTVAYGVAFSVLVFAS